MSGIQTPDAPPDGKFYVRRLLIPADKVWLGIVDGALNELTKPYNFTPLGNYSPDDTAAAFDAMYQGYIKNEQDRPYWEDDEEAGDNEPPSGQPWYDDLADWIIEAFLAVCATPQAAIIYSTTVPKIRVAIKTGNYGALFRILLDNLEIYTGDSYAPLDGLFGQTLDLQAFAAAHGLGSGPWTLRVEHNGSGPNIPSGHAATLSVVRKRLTDAMPIQFRQTDPCLLEYSEDGSSWATAADLSLCAGSGAPIGTMMPFAGTSIPSGWFPCDGAAKSRATYAALFAVIGTAFGAGDGSTTFNLPDLRGRAPIGAGQGSGLTDRVLGATGGEESHALSSGEMPSHTHRWRYYSGAGAYYGAQFGAGDGSYSTAQLLENTGSGTAHNNMQPYLPVNWIIKM